MAQKCRTVDGWNLHIVHVVDQHARQNPAKRKQHPVLLCPGLASSGAIFDLDPSVSVAEHLASKGFDVWIADLRGKSERGMAAFLGPP
jgi:poly(3-hydroxyalkanoate) synthetase